MKKRIWTLTAVLLVVSIAGFAFAAQDDVLRYNSAGSNVSALQRRLAELYYYTFRITGKYQEYTQKAVREFQKDNGLAVTGEADPALVQMIMGDAARPKATPTPAPTVTPKPTATPQPSPTPLALVVPFPGILQYNSTGVNVRRIQTRLQQLGFYQIEISGNYLGNTRNAVREFQQQNGITPDGVVGEKTWKLLFFDAEAVDAYATPRPSPTPAPPEYKIFVNVTTQVVSVYALDGAGEYSRLVKNMVCSTGTASDPTPLKTYTLNGATARWCYFPKWGTYAQYWTRMDASNAFHSVIYASEDPMSLKTGSYTGLGKRASHGCIRLMIEDAKWIYQNCGKGTQAVVYEGPPDEELTMSLKKPPLDYSVMLPKPTAAPTVPPAYSANAAPPMPLKTLRRGAEGEAVYWLQCRLADLGYYKGTITGGYYGGTADAVKAFQRDAGLSVDGVAGRETLNRLYAAALATPAPIGIPASLSTPAPLTAEAQPTFAVWRPDAQTAPPTIPTIP